MATHWKAYHLNKMIQDSLRNRALMGRLLTAPDAVFDEYELTQEERAAFGDPQPAKLRALGVHPILAMVYMIPRDPVVLKQLSMDPVFLDQIKEL